MGRGLRWGGAALSVKGRDCQVWCSFPPTICKASIQKNEKIQEDKHKITPTQEILDTVHIFGGPVTEHPTLSPGSVGQGSESPQVRRRGAGFWGPRVRASQRTEEVPRRQKAGTRVGRQW